MKIAITTKEKARREYGTVKRFTRFALFPVSIDNKMVWFERYYVYKEWKEQGSGRIAYDGMFVRSYYDGWVIIKKEIIL